MAEGSNGSAKCFFAELRRPSARSDAEYNDDEWYEEQQRQRQELAVGIGKAYNVSVERRENWKRRYWG